MYKYTNIQRHVRHNMEHTNQKIYSYACSLFMLAPVKIHSIFIELNYIFTSKLIHKYQITLPLKV